MVSNEESMNEKPRMVFSIIDTLSACWLEQQGLMVTNRETRARMLVQILAVGSSFHYLTSLDLRVISKPEEQH